MNNDDPIARNGITCIVEELCTPASYKNVAYRYNHDIPMPSVSVLEEIVDDLRSILFPGYFGASEFSMETMPYYVGSTLDLVSRKLSEQVRRGIAFQDTSNCKDWDQDCMEIAYAVTERFLQTLPQVRALLSLDVQAAFTGDPATINPGETIFCYPSIRALTNYRIAHELFKLDVPLIPRIITEIAHSQTGIDIHPGAQIGESFFMDHGTGIVIGATSIIGKGVRIYQGVTLGARSFPVDEDGKLTKGIARHPVVEDDVIIYSGATILGRIVIGKGSEIGGNVWLTHSVPPGSRIRQGMLEETRFDQGGGI